MMDKGVEDVFWYNYSLEKWYFFSDYFFVQRKRACNYLNEFQFIFKSGEILYVPQFISFSLKSDGEQLIPKHIIIIL